MGLVEYHIERTIETPLPVMEVERQKIENLVEEYEDVFPEVDRFLRCYWATPHETTKLALAELMFPGRKVRTRLPVGATPQQMDFEELSQRDLEKKMRMKAHADRRKHVKTSDI